MNTQEYIRSCPALVKILLQDKTTGKNIIWATNNYKENGRGFGEREEIQPEHIEKIVPRRLKQKEEQSARTKSNAEVFTPSWVCNKQNNLIDDDWFGRRNVFNAEGEKSWVETTGTVSFSGRDGETWSDYVLSERLEITCGEAPYLVSRYDTVTGEYIPVQKRIGILDRKLRVVGENVTNDDKLYLYWATRAVQSSYGYEFQGDSLFLARENLLCDFIEHFLYQFDCMPSIKDIENIAYIVSWNVWQMDGLKCVIPFSCHAEEVQKQQSSFFDDGTKEHKPCRGCLKKDMFSHNGIYSTVRDWTTGNTIAFVSLMTGRVPNEK